MKEQRPGRARAASSEQRIDEATALGGLDYFVVACPKDMTMYSDAIKTSGHEGEIELRELTELVLEALGAAACRRAGDGDDRRPLMAPARRVSAVGRRGPRRSVRSVR